jgi:magnesium transporter
LAELIIYNKDTIQFLDNYDPELVKDGVQDNNIKLVITALNEEVLINQICSNLDIHPLLIEDIFTTTHIPKVEIFNDYYFLVLKYLEFNTYESLFEIRQISLILKNDTVIAFIEGKSNGVIEEIKKRLREYIGNLRALKADYLFYRIIDLTVDQYLSAVNYIRAKVDDMEDLTVEGQTGNISHEIVEIKRQINQIRRISVPLREEIIRIRNNSPGLIRKSNLAYFQDILDHLANNISSLENFRDVLNDLMEIHFAQMSANMNQIMKTLTVVTAIFIPLTFIAGVYGMNFDYLPEIRWKYGYLFFWMLVIAVIILMVTFMRKKKWF